MERRTRISGVPSPRDRNPVKHSTIPVAQVNYQRTRCSGGSHTTDVEETMYQPAHFREDRLDVQHSLIRQHPLGLVITAGIGGLMANPLPFLLDPSASEHGTLYAHLARANPQAQELATVADVLVVFQGPQQYVTPSWYATKHETGKVVPTWNYATVHAWGRPTVIEDPAWLRHHVAQLTQQHEHARPAPSDVADAP